MFVCQAPIYTSLANRTSFPGLPNPAPTPSSQSFSAPSRPLQRSSSSPPIDAEEDTNGQGQVSGDQRRGFKRPLDHSRGKEQTSYQVDQPEHAQRPTFSYAGRNSESQLSPRHKECVSEHPHDHAGRESEQFERHGPLLLRRRRLSDPRLPPSAQVNGKRHRQEGVAANHAIGTDRAMDRLVNQERGQQEVRQSHHAQRPPFLHALG